MTINPELAQLASSLAARAGQLLVSTRSEHLARGNPADSLGKVGDAASQAALAHWLAQEAPGDAVLSEEAKDSTSRLTADQVWIIDPLDGTREYSQGRADWAVHVAVWERGDLVAGAVAIPDEGLVLDSGTVAHTPGDVSVPWRLAVSRSRPPALIAALEERLSVELVPMGSAGVKVCSVVRGHCDAYVHAGGQYEWDSAAPVADARAAGLHTSRIDGSRLRYNRADTYLPDLVVCRPELAADLLKAIASTRALGETR